MRPLLSEEDLRLIQEVAQEVAPLEEVGSMRVLITGGGGNLGRVLAPKLDEAEHEPILMDNQDLSEPFKTVIPGS